MIFSVPLYMRDWERLWERLCRFILFYWWFDCCGQNPGVTYIREAGRRRRTAAKRGGIIAGGIAEKCGGGNLGVTHTRGAGWSRTGLS